MVKVNTSLRLIIKVFGKFKNAAPKNIDIAEISIQLTIVQEVFSSHYRRNVDRNIVYVKALMPF